MQAAGALAGQGLQGLQSQQAILAAQTGAGEAQRLIEQQGFDAAYQQTLAQQQYPLTQFGVLTGAASAFPGGYGTTTTTERDPFGSAGRLMAGFGAFGQGGGFGMFK